MKDHSFWNMFSIFFFFFSGHGDGMALVFVTTPTGLVFKPDSPPSVHQSAAKRKTRVSNSTAWKELVRGEQNKERCMWEM